jgi:hypothetical protein
LRISTRVKMSLLVLRCRRSGSANGKPLQGYCFRLLRQRLLLINSRLRTAVRSSDSTPLYVAAVSTHRRGAKTSPSPVDLEEETEVKPCFLDTEPDIYPMQRPGTQCLFCLGDVSLAASIRTRCFANPFHSHPTRAQATSSVPSYRATTHLSSPFMLLGWVPSSGCEPLQESCFTSARYRALRVTQTH